MDSPKLKYVSEPLRCGLPDGDVTRSAVVADWEIYSVIKETGDTRNDNAIYEYSITIERDIQKKKDRGDQTKEMLKFRKEAFSIIESLKLVWPYVFGRPQTANREIQSRDSPRFWTTNSRDLINKLHYQEIRAEVSVANIPWVILPYYSLPKLIEARSAYKEGDYEIRQLVQFHQDILILNNLKHEKSSPGRHAVLFLLAKALELVQAILPGSKRKEKLTAVSERTREELSSDLDWLFNVANNRLEIRHVVRDKNNVELHPPLTQEERSQFEQDASLLIRDTVCRHLGVGQPVVIADTGYSIEELRRL